MTRFEFMEELRLRLAVLSEEERTDALQFYEEYFEDAGPENEQAVIAELGSPAALAERILSGEGKASVWKNGRDTYSQSAPGNGGYREFASRRAGQPAYAAGAQQKKHSGWMALAIILIVLGSPIWLSVLFAIFICIVAAVMTVGAVFLAVRHCRAGHHLYRLSGRRAVDDAAGYAQRAVCLFDRPDGHGRCAGAGAAWRTVHQQRLPCPWARDCPLLARRGRMVRQCLA